MTRGDICIILHEGWKEFSILSCLFLDISLPEGLIGFITLSGLGVAFYLLDGWKRLLGVAWAASLVYL